MISYFRKFFTSEQSGGLILLICTAISLIIANSQLSSAYAEFFEIKLGPTLMGFVFQKTIHTWINEGLMAVFFLLIGLEIKREMISGELSSYQKAILPVISAVGGMIMPAFLFFIVNHNKPTVSGWGIPTATDIAFSLAVLSLIKGIPKSIRIFLVALAVADDIGAIILIGVFYTSSFNLLYCALSLLVFAILFIINKLKVKNIVYYLALGLILWLVVMFSGIHSTIAGVLLAFTIPYEKGNRNSILHKIENFLFKPVAYIILPLFALANTGIEIQNSFFNLIKSPVSIGIIIGLCLGKPLGIVSAIYISFKCKISPLPTNTSFLNLIALGFICGIGYTMSIFISTIAFSNHVFINESKITVLIASVISASIGLILFKISKKII
ncbi:MAG: Na+/H+ antiporter NhaA [Candidatus Kapabacteria bacterium]|nr:Na+/H+ antiporter NhaA [Candidatus Kapabacteria bacterium]